MKTPRTGSLLAVFAASALALGSLLLPSQAAAHDKSGCGLAKGSSRFSAYVVTQSRIIHSARDWRARVGTRGWAAGPICEASLLRHNAVDAYMKTFMDRISSGSWVNCASRYPGWYGRGPSGYSTDGWYKRTYSIPSGCYFTSRTTRARTLGKIRFSDGTTYGKWAYTDGHRP